MPKDLWITSSDNFASWGGGGPEYNNDDLVSLIHAVDYISVHIYPFHDTHYNPSFWTENLKISPLSNDPVNFQKRQFLENQIEILMENALSHSQQQYAQVLKYITDLGIDKPIHIGETGWASLSDGIYGPEGSRAADEYKQALYYHKIMSWTRSIGISCFFFEAFNEPWKSPLNPEDSENHFGLFTTNGKAKYALWPLVEQGIFIGLSRDGSPIEKTQSGHKDTLWSKVLMSSTKINNHNIE